MHSTQLFLMLADDDQDDCLFFKEVLEELQVDAILTIVNDGEQLMNLLNSPDFVFPDALFLDLNMPRKNGVDCLREIRQNINLDTIPVIIFSTSRNAEVVNLLHENGATFYIQKPSEFSTLKSVISKSLELISEKSLPQPPLDKFVLN